MSVESIVEEIREEVYQRVKDLSEEDYYRVISELFFDFEEVLNNHA
jgi:hypothetical protein